MEKSLDDEIGKKDALANTVKYKDAFIDDMERQINEYRDKVARTEEQLEETKEQYSRGLETQEAVNKEHAKQLNEHKARIAQQEKHLGEVIEQHTQEVKKLQCDVSCKFILLFHELIFVFI